jgi:hypothetical protein
MRSDASTAPVLSLSGLIVNGHRRNQDKGFIGKSYWYVPALPSLERTIQHCILQCSVSLTWVLDDIDKDQEPCLNFPQASWSHISSPLLSEDDARYLEAFFYNLSANWDDFPLTSHDGSEPTQTWKTLPPLLVGMTVSFGLEEDTKISNSPSDQGTAQAEVAYGAFDSSLPTPPQSRPSSRQETGWCP